MNYQRRSISNDRALESFEITAVHYGFAPLYPHRIEAWPRPTMPGHAWQWSRPEPLGFLKEALRNLFGEQWRERLR